MAARFEVAVRTPAAAAGAAYAVLVLGTNPVFLRELSLFTSAATASSVGLLRALTNGTASTTAAGQNYNPGDSASAGVVSTAWTVAPTIAASPAYLRRFTSAAVIGAGIVWSWPYGEGLEIKAAAGLAIWNFGAAAGSALDLTIAWEE